MQRKEINAIYITQILAEDNEGLYECEARVYNIGIVNIQHNTIQYKVSLRVFPSFPLPIKVNSMSQKITNNNTHLFYSVGNLPAIDLGFDSAVAFGTIPVRDKLSKLTSTKVEISPSKNLKWNYSNFSAMDREPCGLECFKNFYSI